MEAVATYCALSFFKPIFKGIGITGTDLHKRHKPEIPEGMGIVAGLILCMFMTRGPVFYCTLLGLWIGALDDIIDIRWRTKLLMSTCIYIPLFQQTTTILLFGNVLELGILYHVYIILWCIWCGNSINIYAGINGIECGQCLIIACGLFFVVPGIFGYICVCSVLFYFNWFPASIFVGDSWCYLSGAFFVAVAQHETETLAIMMLPQIVNTLFSLPELLGECPRHRMPTYDVKNDVLLPSGNGTLLNNILRLCGPMSEVKLCSIALFIQCICVITALIVKS